MRKAFVIGGSGFIGSHLVELLLKRKYKVAIYDIKKPDGFNFVGAFFEQSVLDRKALELSILTFKPNVIFECSGILGTAETFEHIEKAIDVNIKGTINVLELAKKYKLPVVYIGLTNKWLNPYTISKRASEKFCLMYAKEFGVKVTVLKGLNAYGPRQHWSKVRKIAPTFIVRAIKNEDIIINGTGNQIVDMVHATDLAEMMIRIYEKGNCWGLSFDGGTGIPMTVNEVAQKIIKMVGSKSKIIHKKMRKGEPKMSVTLANPAPVRQLLDFYPQISFEKGMKETIRWYRKNYKTFDK